MLFRSVYNETLCKVKLDDGKIWREHMSLMEVEYDDVLPMWGTMWSFGDSCDEHWLDDRYGYVCYNNRKIFFRTYFMKFNTIKIRTITFLAVFSLILTAPSYAYAGLKISCSMFPVYDFTRAVTAGTSSDVRLILKPGTEPHEFEPSPMDVKALNDSDVFVFIGRQMEHWADRIASTISNTLIVDASNGMALTGSDPHIWLDLSLAQKMIYNITESLCNADPAHSGTYTHNAAEYCAKLADLDEKFAALPKNRTIVFAGEFSCGYFLRRYGFDYVSAYEGENEPGLRRMAEIIRHIQENHTKYILSDLPISRVTEAISEQTRTEILPFSTAHTVQDTSQTYLQIMIGNFANLARLLND